MRLKLISDGTAAGSRIIDETGEPLENVQAFTLEHDKTHGEDLFLTITVKVGGDNEAPVVGVEEDEEEFSIMQDGDRFHVLSVINSLGGGRQRISPSAGFRSREAAEIYIESIQLQDRPKDA